MKVIINAPKKFDISKLKKEQLFYVTMMSRFLEECVEENIITGAQKGDACNLMLKKLTPKD